MGPANALLDSVGASNDLAAPDVEQEAYFCQHTSASVLSTACRHWLRR